MADHRRQHRQRDVVDPAHADAGHDEVEEHEDPGAHFGHAGEIGGEVRRGARADADHRAGKARAAQGVGGGDDRQPFLLGGAAQRLGTARRIAAAGMGQDAAQFGRRPV